MTRPERFDLEEARRADRERAATEREARARRDAEGQVEATRRSLAVAARWNEAAGWLKAALGRPPRLPDDVVLPPAAVAFDPGPLEIAEPPPRRPPLIQRLAGRDGDYRDALASHRAREADRMTRLSAAAAAHRRAVESAEEAARQRNAAIPEWYHGYRAGDASDVAAWLGACLEAEPAFAGHRSRVESQFLAESRQLVIDYDMPSLACLPEESAYRYVKASGEVVAQVRPAGQRQAAYLSLLAQTALRVLHACFVDDTERRVDTIALNGFVSAVEPATGRAVRPCVLSLRTSRSRFEELELDSVEPVACLRGLKAVLSRHPEELAPVRPVISLERSDRRFVDEEQILGTLESRPNLLALSPGEFESLITNLFSCMGLETRLTQASRDGGVDCVAFDLRPVLGGKVVIQAKRYTDTVGVSAVRDLYGTVMNEGACKGILVTTSGYGAAAFDFAAGKPLELLSGANLLSLLSDFAGVDARIVPVDSGVPA